MREDIKERIKLIKCGMVPEGYRTTNQGIMSSDFEEIELSEIGEFKNGINFSKGNGDNVVQFLGVGDFGELSTLNNTDNLDKIYVEASDEQLSSYFLRDDDIVFVRSNGSKELVGRNLLVKNPADRVVYSGFCIRYRMHDNDKHTSMSYINAWLENGALKAMLKSENRGTNINNLNQEILRKIKIYIPSIGEQEKILKVLDGYNDIILKLENLIENKMQQKNGLCQNLLTGKKRLPGFDDEWCIWKLSNVLKERKKYSEKDGTYELVTLAKEGIIPKTNRYDREHLVKTEDKEYKVTYIDDICYNPANLKFGVICRNTYGDAIFSPIYVTFEVKKECNVDYMAQLLTRNEFIRKIRKYEEGTVYERMAVKPENFLRYEIILPSYEEQCAIAKILELADKEIYLLKEKLHNIMQEKKAILNLLLKGIVRVDMV